MVFLNNIIQPLLMAVTLLTRLPVTRFVSADLSSLHYQHSAYYYPLVGLGIGAILCGLTGLLPQQTPPLLLATLILAAWIAITGALHLDGLADSCDAYFAAHKDGQKALVVMQDPTSGPMAVVAVFMVLSLKVAALVSLGQAWMLALMVTPLLARAAVLLLMNTTAYAREDEGGGMVSGLNQPRANLATWLIVVLCCGFTVWALPLAVACICLLAVALLLYLWRKLWLQLIQGFTGDCLGGLIEITETLVLIILALASVEGLL